MATRRIQCNEIVIRATSAEEATAMLNRIIGRGDVDLAVTLGIRIEIDAAEKKEPKAKR